MPANPYAVTPGGDYSQALTGLSSAIGQTGQIFGQQRKERLEKERISKLKQQAKMIYSSGTPEDIAEFTIQHPEFGKHVTGLMKHRSETTKKNYEESIFQAVADPSKIGQIKLARQALNKSQGLTPEETTHTDGIMERYEKDPEGTLKSLEREAAAMNPERYLKWQETQEGRTGKQYSPSGLKKLIDERQDLIDQGTPLDDPFVQAYDNRIAGTDLSIEDMTQEEVDMWGALINAGGKLPSLGRGKNVAKARMAIAKSAARQALGGENIPDIPGKTPSEAAMEVIGTQSDTKAIQGSLNFLEKQIGSMGSFVNNLEQQVDKVSELSKDLKTFDTRLLNTPLRSIRGSIIGSPLQAKYDMYLTEIENEIGKLASGSSASIAELSVGAQEKWERIHDKKLSVNDMMELLEETKKAARMRQRSVEDQLNKTRVKMRKRDKTGDFATPVNDPLGIR